MGFTSKKASVPVPEAVAIPAVAQEAEVVSSSLDAKNSVGGRNQLARGINATWTRFASGDKSATGVKTLLGS